MKPIPLGPIIARAARSRDNPAAGHPPDAAAMIPPDLFRPVVHDEPHPRVVAAAPPAEPMPSAKLRHHAPGCATARPPRALSP
jgi:hypothetical protein